LSAVALGTGALAAFHLAFGVPRAAFLIAVFLACLLELARLSTPRRAFYSGLSLGLGGYAPHLLFFWSIFGPAAVALWLVLAFWLGAFLLVAQQTHWRLGRFALALCAPLLWTGLEYFRSELYYLRFSWLSVGYAFSASPRLPVVLGWGVYGAGFVLMLGAALVSLAQGKRRWICGLALLGSLAALINLPGHESLPPDSEATTVRIAGLQLEGAPEDQLIRELDQSARQCPEAALWALPEYTFTTPVPDEFKNWCRTNRKYLVVGGQSPVAEEQFHNTAYVIGPEGSEVFRQVKSVPIQFFADGLPAADRRVWRSPWGKLGFCVCYDLSYRRVVDDFVRQGAQALIVPTMHLKDWGRSQHELAARVAPVRAAEYGLPVFVIASSGISQSVDAHGRELVRTSFPGQGESIRSGLQLSRGRVPLDAMLAPWASVFAFALACLLAFRFALTRARFGRAIRDTLLNP
jgi:apolipoprotein N-acyltransferase